MTPRCAMASSPSEWSGRATEVEIARKLDELGISRIEAGFPKVSSEDGEGITVMRQANLKAELRGFS